MLITTFHILIASKKNIAEEKKKRNPINNINQQGATGKILSQINMEKIEKAAAEKKKKEDAAKAQGGTANKAMEAMSNKAALPYNAASYTTGKASASLTSTAVSVSTANDRVLMSHEEYMFPLIKSKGYGSIITNFGKINVELFCDQVKAPPDFLCLDSFRAVTRESFTAAEG